MFRWFKRSKSVLPGYQPGKSDVADEKYIVEAFAKCYPADQNYSIGDRLKAFERAAKSAGLSGYIRPDQFDLLHYHYRVEMELLARFQGGTNEDTGVH